MSHTDRFERKRAELYEDIVGHTAKVLTDLGVDEKGAELAANQLADYLADQWGGQNFCFPKDHLRKLSKRELELYERYTGSNHGDLAREFGLTERGVYKILARVRERLRRNAKGHPQLFETS